MLADGSVEYIYIIIIIFYASYNNMNFCGARRTTF
jgi:hypothetical protein